jgi:hypothetical protein
MNIILRNTETGLLYAGPEKWTDHYAEAIDFHQPNAALDHVEEEKLEAVEVLMHFENTAVSIPLTIVKAGNGQ